MWTLLIVTEIIIFLGIFFIRKTKKISEKIDLVLIISGGSQKISPTTNILRIIFSFLAIFFIIIRTAYQAQLYKIMQNDDEKLELMSLDEMLDRNYKLCATKTFHEFISLSDRGSRLQKSLEIMEWKKIENFFHECRNFKEKKAVATTHVNIATSVVDISECKVMEETLWTNQIVFLFQKNHFLTQPVDRVMSRFKSAELIERWIAEYEKPKIRIVPNKGTKSSHND